ncbi:MAG: MoaD/ThiS family protein [Desulfosarcina sp.]|nr:MoaD/ThiS family protein [Desulfobacterales bacterium]
MAVMIRIPGSLKSWLDGKTELICQGENVSDCIDYLDQKFPGVKSKLLDQDGNISNILIFLNGDNLRNLGGLQTPVNDSDEISMIPLFAGG